MYKTCKQFFYISNCFRVILCQKRVFDLVASTQSLLRHFGPIFTFKTAITQRLFEGSKNCLKVLYAFFFVSFLMVQVIFVVI